MESLIGNGANQLFSTMWVDVLAKGMGERFPTSKGAWWNTVLYTILIGILGLCLRGIFKGLDKFHVFLTSDSEHFY